MSAAFPVVAEGFRVTFHQACTALADTPEQLIYAKLVT